MRGEKVATEWKVYVSINLPTSIFAIQFVVFLSMTEEGRKKRGMGECISSESELRFGNVEIKSKLNVSSFQN